jgi:Mycothiol maleylpyruvate isomerase N-terminal domain
MIADDDPLFPNWDQDETAIADRYSEQEPRAVAVGLVAAADALAARFDAVTPDQWQRSGRRSDGAAFTVDSFARYLIHDPIHHLWDVDRPI